MAEPQEHSIQEKILSVIESKNKIVIEESKGLPKEKVSVAQQRLDGFKILKTELDTDMQVVLEKLGAMKNKVKENAHSRDNPNGLLTKDVALYQACLNLEHEKLEVLYRGDETAWRDNLKKVKKQAGKIEP